MSNMTPQPSRFNQVTWNNLERLTRAWANQHESLWIISGPILHDNLPTIGRVNRVSVPAEYFKVIMRKDKNSFKAIAFLIPTNVPHNNLIRYTLSVRELEDYTQINFFKFLNKKDEAIEEVLDTSAWDFTAKFDALPCLSRVVQ